jgi:hypothetical protein
MSKPTRQSPPNWKQVWNFAILSLACFLCGIGLLAVMLWNGERLVALGLVGQLYYIVLLPLGLAVAGFLFGVMRSFAAYKGKAFGGVLDLGGPIIGFALTVLGGFYLPNPAPESFDVTVFVRGQKGANDLVLRNTGTVWMALGSDRRSEKIGDKGQADFKHIPQRFRGSEVSLSVEADGFEVLNPNAKHSLASGVVSITVRRPAAQLKVRVQDPDGKPVNGATIRYRDLKGETNAEGRTTVELPPDTSPQSAEGEIIATGFEPWRGQLLPNGVEAGIILRRTP